MPLPTETLACVAANMFLEAKLKEFEASCFFGDSKRSSAVEEDCRSALQGLLDAKREMVARLKSDAAREARRNQ